MRVSLLIFAVLSGPVNPTCLAQPPRTFTFAPAEGRAALPAVVAALIEQTNLPVRAAAADADAVYTGEFDAVSAWVALERLARQTGHRIVPRENGRVVALERGMSLAPSATDGPFRLVLGEVVTRRDLASDTVTHHLGMLLHWEPRVRVLRIDAYPELRATVKPGRTPYHLPRTVVRKPVSGAAVETLVRLEGYTGRFEEFVPGEATFRATVANKTLAFRFDDLTGVPAARESDGVRVSLTGIQVRGGRTLVTVEMTYPPGLPEFESFENWQADNRIALIPPGGGREFTTDDYQLIEAGGKTRATYVFRDVMPGDRAGWALTYETPSPPCETTLTFRFAD